MGRVLFFRESLMRQLFELLKRGQSPGCHAESTELQRNRRHRSPCRGRDADEETDREQLTATMQKKKEIGPKLSP